MLGWRPLFTLDEGLRAHDRLVPRVPAERRRERDAARAARAARAGLAAGPLARRDAARERAAAPRTQLDEPEPTLPARPRVLPRLLAGADHRDGAAGGALPRLRLLLVVLRHDAARTRRTLATRARRRARARRRTSLVVEVASNDGYLLAVLPRGAACRCSASSRRGTSRRSREERGIPTIAEFFGARARARDSSREGAPRRRRSTRTTSSPTSPDLNGFVAGIATAAQAEDGVAVIEVPYVQATCSTAASSTRSTTSTSATSR